MNNEMNIWINIAKKYGAIFDNIELIYINKSFTLQAVNKNKESILKIPLPLLLPEKYIIIENDLHYVDKGLDIPNDLRELLDKYLAFILSDARVFQQKRLLNKFLSISPRLKTELNFFSCTKLVTNLSKKDHKIHLIQSRLIYKSKERVLIPFADFVDHDSNSGLGFEIDNDSIMIKRKASQNGKFYAKYNDLYDAFSYMSIYLFVPLAENIMSIDVAFEIDSHTRLSIGRDYSKITIDTNGIMTPKYTILDNTISLPILWLGSHKKPRNPFWSFKRLWEDHIGREDTQRVYSIIKSLNMQKLTSIIRICDQSSKQNEAISMIRESAMQHITIIGESYEDLLSYPIEMK